MKEQSSRQRVSELGSRLATALEPEDDPAVMLSALALMVAVVCDEAGEGRPEGYRTMAEGFIQTFRTIRRPAEVTH